MKTEGGYPGHPYWVRLRESALPPFARAGVFARIRVMGVDQNVVQELIELVRIDSRLKLKRMLLHSKPDVVFLFSRGQSCA